MSAARQTRTQEEPSEANLVAVRVTEGGFTDTIVIGLELLRLQAAGCDRGKLPVEVIDEDRDQRISDAASALLDVETAVIGELPHGSVGVATKVGGDPTRRSYQASERA
jgi:hypothetical protein